ncbi:hypothetical protein KSC_040620 [Ktedonobacter sp. SOSP1-52]|uniref:hypothetical protein n=1 Tax=Ktedonobacter sp. SOSP1-52 TaxID=2778366 RepID=UPI001914EF23|nr:hypothetical protein [Ktedonobacter sp. SOSP1-52]GHO65170.1 hypothetical protein KSC_040620 [Ktedonobacter sp. SOSP1-52]
MTVSLIHALFFLVSVCFFSSSTYSIPYACTEQGNAKYNWISREDCARAATGALISKLTTIGPVDVTGPEALSFADLASRLSSLSD